MLLLHIAGVTRTNKSFSAAFCFLAEESQPYYEWALNSLITLLNANNVPLPKVDVTDLKQALINSLSKLIPSAHHLLCTWHIQKNLVTNAAKMI